MALTPTHTRIGTGNLNASTSWSPNAAPSAAMIGSWNGSSGASGNAGGSFTIGALHFASNAPAVTIGNTSGATITIQGVSDGTTTYLVEGNNTTNSVLVYNAVRFGGSGTYYVTSGRYVGLYAAVTNAAGVEVTKTGAGNWIMNGSNGSFNATINHTEGYIALGNPTTNPLGTGTLNLNGGTLTVNGNVGAITLANTINVNADTNLSALNLATFTFNGPSFNFGATTRTLETYGVVTISAPVTGTSGFTKSGGGDLFIGGATKALTTEGSAAVTLLSGTLLINAGAYTGTPNQLANVTKYAVSSTLLYTGNLSFTEVAEITGSGNVQANVSPGVMTYSGNVSAYTGYLSAYTATNNATVATVFSTQQAFPALASTYSDIPGNAVNATFIWRYTGAGAVSGSGRHTSAFRTSNGSSALVTEFDNASSNAAAVTFTGDFTTLPGSTVVGGSHVVRFNASAGDIVVSGAILAAVTPRSVAKTGTFKTTLSNPANTYTGVTTVSAGTLAVSGTGTGTYLGAAAGTVSVAASATLELSSSGAGVTVTKSSSLSINGTGVGGNGALRSTAGDNTYNASGITLATSSSIQVDAGSLALTAAIGGSSTGLTKTGTGTLRLSSASSNYTGATAVNAGTLAVSKLALAGAVSSLGQPAAGASATVTMGANTTLRHEGTTADTTDRTLTLSAVGTLTLDSSGTGVGAVTLTSAGSIALPASGSCELVFTGTNTAENVCARAVVNPATSGATALTKSGANTWKLTGTLSHGGLTKVTEGALDLGNTARTLSGGLRVEGGTVQNGTATAAANVTLTGGTITAKLADDGVTQKTLTVSSGTATLEPTGGSNEYSGTTTVAADATLRLKTDVNPATTGAGKMCGNSPVLVSGTLRTGPTGAQKGRARFGGNLTFNTGAKFYVGAL